MAWAFIGFKNRHNSELDPFKLLGGEREIFTLLFTYMIPINSYINLPAVKTVFSRFHSQMGPESTLFLCFTGSLPFRFRSKV